jgi:hypothetical protein
VIVILCALAVVRLWILPAWNSFSLDETLIVWTIRGGFASIVPNAFISLQSIPFCMLEWLVTRAGGSEIALRMPSLLAACGAIFVYYRIGVEAEGRELGLLLAALYISWPSVAIEAANARPYALALLLHAAALYWLLAWMRSGRLRHGLLWILCAACAAHLHYLFVVALPLETLFAAWTILSRRTPVRFGHLLWCAASGVVLLLPALPQARVVLSQGSLLSYLARPSWWALLYAVLPLAILPALGVAALLEWRAGRPLRWSPPKAGAGVAALGALISFVPTLACFAASRFTGVRVFEHKYLLPAVAGSVLFWGWAIRGLETAALRRKTAVILVALNSFIFMAGGPALVRAFPDDNWRAALRSLPDSGALFVYTGLVETRRLDWLQAPERWGYLTAPVSAYRPGLSPDRTFVLPFGISPADEAYVDDLVARRLVGQPRVSVLVREAFAGLEWSRRLAGRLASAGFQEERRFTFGALQLRVFRAIPR